MNGPVFKFTIWEPLQQVAGDAESELVRVMPTNRKPNLSCCSKLRVMPTHGGMFAPKHRGRLLPYILGKGCCTEIGVMPMAYVAFSLANHWISVSVSLKNRFFHVSRTWPFFQSHAV
jgi:hypothetical protein